MESLNNSTEKDIQKNIEQPEKTKASTGNNESFESEKVYHSSDEEKMQKKDSQDLRTFTNEVVIIRPE